MSQKAHILFVDDVEVNRQAFLRGLRKAGHYEVYVVSNGVAALQMLKKQAVDIVITDMQMPEMDGITLLKEIRERFPDIFVIVQTGYGSIENAVTAMKLGAYDYLLKPFDFNVIQMLLEKIIKHSELLRQSEYPPEDPRESYRFENIIGQDRKMFKIYEMINAVAKTTASILVTGESGSGKELVAEAIHYRSDRRDKPYQQVNCAALTETIINSELFGYEKGAFTGADQRKIGLFELADGGTLFLDEIGDIPLQTQISLLRVLEMGTFQRVGGGQTIEVDTRIVCATNQDLAKAIKEKRFREDLYYRINVVSIDVPPLRERILDIPLLTKYFLEKYSRQNNKKIRQVSKSIMDLLMQYDWPGNVRELANAINHALIFCKGKEIVPGNLPAHISAGLRARDFQLTLISPSLPKAEAALIKKVLEMNNWNLKQAAADLAIARGTLYSKMERYSICKPDNAAQKNGP